MEPYEAHEEGTNISSEQLNFSRENDCGRFGEPVLHVSELRYYNEPEATVSFQETVLKKKVKKAHVSSKQCHSPVENAFTPTRTTQHELQTWLISSVSSTQKLPFL